MTNETDTRQSIRTRYHGPTNKKQSRISVICCGYSDGKRKRLFVNYDHDLTGSENHAAAAQAWLDKHNPGRESATRPGYLRRNKVAMPGLCFDEDFFWTWREQVTFTTDLFKELLEAGL